MKKLASLLTAFALATASLVAANPAQAIPSSVTTLPAGFTAFGSKAVGVDTFVYGDLVDQGTEKLVGYTVDWNGTVLDNHVFEILTGQISRTSPGSFAILKDGTEAFTWSVTNATTYDSQVKVAFTNKFGIWGTSTAATPVLKGVAASWNSNCGYTEPRIAQDSKGLIGISYFSGQTQDATKHQFVGMVTSKTKTKWAVPVVKQLPIAANSFLKNTGLIPLPAGGFSFAFDQTAFLDGITTFWTGFLPTGKKAFTSVKSTVDRRYPWTMGEPIKASATKYYRLISVFDPGVAPGQGTFVCYQTLNTAAKSWSAISCLPGTVPGTITDTNLVSSTDGAGDVTIVYASSLPSTSSYQFHELDIVSGVLVNTDNVVGTSAHSSRVISLSRNAIGAGVLVYDSDFHVYQAQLVDGELGAGTQLFATLGSNDTYFSDVTAFNTPAMVRQTDSFQAEVRYFVDDSAPILSKASLISGKTKVGSTLKASNSEFNSPSGYGSAPGQWYRCDIQLGLMSYNFVPQVCTLITNARGESYKLTAADKGKYIAYQMLNHNNYAASQVLSKTTGKIS